MQDEKMHVYISDTTGVVREVFIMARQSFKQEIKNELLKGRLQEQRSKYDDQRQDREYMRSAGEDFDKTKLLEKHYFYRRDTYEACLKTACKFVAWVRDSGLTERRLPIREYDKFIVTYIEARIASGEVTARTIAKERSHLSKVWEVNTDHIRIPAIRTESEKGRTPDRYYNMSNEKHAEATAFYTMIGARKGEYHFLTSEEFRDYKDQVKDVAGIDIRYNREGQCPNIYPVRNENTGLIDRVVVVHAKHGKTNISEILPEHQREVTRIFESKEYRDFFYPSDHCNVHQCRRDYAQALYAHYARPIEELRREEKYICKDGSFRQFDREALAKVAVSLGHQPNDLFDTVHNYMR